VTGNQHTNVGGNELPQPLHTCPGCGRTYELRGWVTGTYCPECGYYAGRDDLLGDD
jgi:ribosomal protein L32